jgi:hypothetical protein
LYIFFVQAVLSDLDRIEMQFYGTGYAVRVVFLIAG